MLYYMYLCTSSAQAIPKKWNCVKTLQMKVNEKSEKDASVVVLLASIGSNRFVEVNTCNLRNSPIGR